MKGALLIATGTLRRTQSGSVRAPRACARAAIRPQASGEAPRYTLEELAARIENATISNGILRGACPICDGYREFWARHNADGRLRVGCWRATNWGEEWSEEVPHDWQELRKLLGIEGDFSGTLLDLEELPEPGDALDMITDAVVLNKVYRALLMHLEMPAERMREYLSRYFGVQPAISDKMSALLGPRPHTPGPKGREKLARITDDLLKIAPIETLRRVPDLSGRKNESLTILPFTKGALWHEPWKDVDGRIVALRTFCGMRAEGPYQFASGRWGAPVHYAVGVAPSAIATARWYFTTSWLNAEIVAHAWDAVGVGLPGIEDRGSWARAVEILQRLAPNSTSIVAFGAETWTTRPDYATWMFRFAHAIYEATGKKPLFAVWDAAVLENGIVTPSGLGDAIVACAKIRLVDRVGFTDYFGPALDQWDLGHAS